MVQRAFVEFDDYNGYKDVKFVMRPEDIDFRRSLGTTITLIAHVDVKKGAFVYDGVAHTVHSDWSVSVKNP